MLISVDNVTFDYGGNLIFKDVSFSINEGDRIALIGANGEGKTTLIKVILSQLEPSDGEVFKKSGIKIGYLEQNGGFESGNTVYGEMKLVFREEFSAVEKLNSLSKELSEADYQSKEYEILSAKLESLNKYISANDCFNAEVKIKTVLNGLGFADMYERVIDGLSGGEKTRLKLAKLLLEQPELLILDEPTNHLDIASLFWLEEYLQTFKGAIFVVSHDRYFLDRIVSSVVELENKNVLLFKGNYSKYKVLKCAYVERRQKEYEAQVEEIKKLQDYVARNIVRATTAKSAQSRVNRLEKMDVLEKPYLPPKPPVFGFEYDEKPYENVLEIKNFNLERGGKRLISNGNLNLKRGKKLALTGANGTGKSSLLKEIVSGNSEISLGRFVKIAYYDQEFATLGGENTVLEEVWGRRTGLTQTEVRAALARSGLFAEDIYKKVKMLSGGEKAKLALCVLELERGNLLILDEPTNHLDLPAREALETALINFDGTLIFVSHDRYFVSAVATAVAEISNCSINYFDGGYKEYTEFINNNKEEPIKKTPEKDKGYRSKKERAEAENRKAEIKRIEEEISKAEEEEALINKQLQDPVILADYKKVLSLSEKLTGIKLQLDGLYKEYELML